MREKRRKKSTRVCSFLNDRYYFCSNTIVKSYLRARRFLSLVCIFDRFFFSLFLRFGIFKKNQSSKNTQSTMLLSGEGVVTRARKRKVGERDSLWDLVVKNDDISLTHIVPRLNATDVKFLYDVNSETRKLIKRSSREE